jgi:hypothetical protein
VRCIQYYSAYVSDKTELHVIFNDIAKQMLQRAVTLTDVVISKLWLIDLACLYIS